MLERYCLEKMKNIWDLKAKYEYYLKVEIAVCEAYSEMGKISVKDLLQIKQLAKFDLTNINNIEKEVQHDVIAFLIEVNNHLGEYAKYMHMGLTSSDVIDTAFALQIKDCGEIIKQDLKSAIKVVKNLAFLHKNTVCIGRSHGVHAEIMTFGIKLLNWVDVLERVEADFLIALENVKIGQISGPVGTYSNVPFELEKIVCDKLGLKPARISTQIIARDIHARFMQSLAMIATVLEQFATEIRHLQRTEVLEAAEGFGEKQKGSSAMPHKKNPILSENLCGLARVVRANSVAAMENIVLWHERDISHSSVERIIFPDSTALVDFMLNRFVKIMENLVINKENMKKNSNLFGGIVYSQKVLLTLVEKGLNRESAYELVQKKALEAFESNGDFKQSLLKDKEVLKVLSQKQIKDCFNEAEYLKNVEEIFKRF